MEPTVDDEEEELEVEEEEEEGSAAASERPDPTVALRLVAAAAWHVVRERRIQDFPRVLALLEAVEEAAPDLVHFQHLAKLRLGLQAKIIMNLLQEAQPHGKIYDALDRYFPENQPQFHPKATPQDLELVQTAHENFRVLVLGLLSDNRHQEKYVQEYLESDYGEAFLQVVEELFNDYLWQLENTLPQPHFQQLLEAAHPQGSSQPSQPSNSILSQYLVDMGYQHTGGPEPLASSTFHSDEEGLVASPPCSHHSVPDGARAENGVSCIPEQGSPGLPSGTWGTAGAAGDMVPDSASEGGSSPFKGEYQDTCHCTLIPTFQEHLRDSRSQYASSPVTGTSPAV